MFGLSGTHLSLLFRRWCKQDEVPFGPEPENLPISSRATCPIRTCIQHTPKKIGPLKTSNMAIVSKFICDWTEQKLNKTEEQIRERCVILLIRTNQHHTAKKDIWEIESNPNGARILLIKNRIPGDCDYSAVWVSIKCWNLTKVSDGQIGQNPKIGENKKWKIRVFSMKDKHCQPILAFF